ncbi:MAG: thiol:disulfide interchange protein DsbA/DsbL [Gammaproteobacteria bacterium]|nr:thiol:disulfide interchange protein DsbA/DsbL [Gammaproteobacteria bacterium]
MAKKARSFLVQQKIAVGVVALIFIALIGYFSTLVVKDSPILGDFVEGEHYTLLEKPRRIRGEKIEVMEFFSYGCVHCYNFDPELNDWVVANIDRVKFIRTPAISSDYWRILGRNYYTMDRLGIVDDYHLSFFREVHEVKRNFTSLNRLGDYFDGKGTTADEYKKVFSSPEVSRKIAAADQMARRLQVASVPTIIVHGKYMIRPTRSVGTARMLEVMDFLVNKELKNSEEPSGG